MRLIYASLSRPGPPRSPSMLFYYERMFFFGFFFWVGRSVVVDWMGNFDSVKVVEAQRCECRPSGVGWIYLYDHYGFLVPPSYSSLVMLCRSCPFLLSCFFFFSSFFFFVLIYPIVHSSYIHYFFFFISFNTLFFLFHYFSFFFCFACRAVHVLRWPLVCKIDTDGIGKSTLQCRAKNGALNATVSTLSVNQRPR